MIKNTCLFVMILLMASCKGQEFIYSNDLPSESDLVIIDIQLGKDKNLLTFVNDFKNDSISVFNDNTLIFNSEISTDPTLGTSKGIQFLKDTKYLRFKINSDKEIKIENDHNYRFIYIFKKENKYTIKYTKKPIKFY